MIKWSAMVSSRIVKNVESARAYLAGTVLRKKGYELSARGAQQQQAAKDERDRGRGDGPEARGGRNEAAHPMNNIGIRQSMQGWVHNPAAMSPECTIYLPSTGAIMRVADLVGAVPAFGEHLGTLRAPCTDVDWYPYNSLDNVSNVKELLPSTAELVPDGGHVLDIGCADGDMGFLFQSLGCHVDFIDNAETNFNDCRGVARTAQLLGHAGRIIERDIDFGFELDRDYDLVLFLGTLYHLRNPALALIRLAERCEWMLLSTRVMSHLPAQYADAAVSDAPIGYLLDTLELNRDSTNWWLFSPMGVTRLLKRCGWTTLTSRIVFDESLPADNRDERMFVQCRRVTNYSDLTKRHDF
jgi:SAM-dependent methyltransferase